MNFQILRNQPSTKQVKPTYPLLFLHNNTKKKDESSAKNSFLFVRSKKKSDVIFLLL